MLNKSKIQPKVTWIIYRTLSPLQSISEKIEEFIDLTHKIYWPTNIAKKEATVKNNIAIYVSDKFIPI